MAGAQIIEDCKVTDNEVETGIIKAVITDQGRIECGQVLLCAGQWSRDFAARFGVTVPLVSMEHQYMVTELIAGIPKNLPTLRDPDRLTYYKDEVGGLVMGGYEPNPISWAVDGIPKGFHYTLLDSNYDHFEPLMELALRVTYVGELSWELHLPVEYTITVYAALLDAGAATSALITPRMRRGWDGRKNLKPTRHLKGAMLSRCRRTTGGKTHGLLYLRA